MKIITRNGKCFYYVGQTNNIYRRYYEHIHNISCQFIQKYHQNSSKILVYVERLLTRELAEQREREIKKMGVKEKEKLISSDCNILEKKTVLFGEIKELVLKA
jgi:predicted GIY-YIG superfamily endonuclease